MDYNCLIVDDEEELAKMTSEYFTLFNVSCSYVMTAKECEQFLCEHTVDLLLLDINLGEQSGFYLCKKIRETSNIPILFLSARQSDEDILTALNIGGDDYIKKPYTLSILLAKVKAVLKRTKLDCPQNIKQEQSKEKMILDQGTLSVILDGKTIPLKAREFKLLQCLYENKNVIVEKQRLFEEVWGDTFFSDGTLNVHIRRLREKLEQNPNKPEIIKTVWGTGYLLELSS